MNKKRIMQIIALVLLLSMMFSTVAFAMPPGQAKMPPGQAKKLLKYEEAFSLMKKKGIMLGDGFGDYRLNDFVKRGDITVMIVRAFKLSMSDKIDDVDNKGDFLDLIDKNNYQYNFVKIAKHYNIAKGDGNKFYPNKFVSYDEAFALIERAVKVANSNVTISIDEDDDVIKLRDWYKTKFTKEDSFKNFLIEMLFDDDELSKKELDKKLSEPATRGDIASMLYYVLTGDKDFEIDEDEDEDGSEIKDINLYLKERDFRGLFKNIDFSEAFEEIEDADEDYVVEYLVFDDMDKDQGDLYYLYNAGKKNNTEAADDEYYFDNDRDDDKREVADLTFVAGEDNISYIEYTAFIYNEDDDDYDEYEGRIIISVADKDLARIRVSIEKETDIDFIDLGFKDFIDEIEFNLEKNSKVTLEINNKALKDAKYKIDDIEEITFIPADGFTGRVDIDYTAYDEGIPYQGVIRVTVTED